MKRVGVWKDWCKNNKWDILVCVFLIILGIWIVFAYGKYKVVDFCDETFTYESANSVYKELPLRTSEKWISGQDVSDYFAATDTWFNHGGIESHLWGDHLPIYFYMFRFVSMYLFHGSSTPWIGLTLNLGIWVALIILLYSYGHRYLKNPILSGVFVALTTICSSVMIDQLFLLRMYLLVSFICLGCLFYASRIVVAKEVNWKDFGLLFIYATTGFVTHYYFWVFMLVLSLICGVQMLIERKWKSLGISMVTVLGSFGLMTIIYPRWRDGLMTPNAQTGVQEALNSSRSLSASFLEGIKRCVVNLIPIGANWIICLAFFLLLVIFALILSWKRDKGFFRLMVTGVMTALLYATIVHFLGAIAQLRYFYPGIILVYTIQFLALLYNLYYIILYHF